MAPASRARLLTAAIPALVSGTVTAWALSTAHWSWWGIATMTMTTPEQTSFGDLKAVLATSLCMQQGTDYTACDPYGRPFAPYVLLPARVLSLGHVDLEDTVWLGVLLAALYVVTVAGLGLLLARLWGARLPGLLAAQTLLGLVAVTAPPMLMLERGQVEVITLALAVVSLALLASRSRAWQAAGAAAGIAAVISKYLAIGLFAPFVRRGRPHWAALIAIAVSAGFLVLSWGDVQQAIATSRAQDPATSQSQFGATAMLATMLSSEPITGIPSPAVVEHWSTVRVAAWVVAGLAIVLATALVRPRIRTTLDSQPVAYALFVGGTGVLVIPFLLGASHDYRLVFLLPTLVGALAWLSVTPRRDRWLPGALVIAIGLAMLTGASMILTPSDSLGPKEFIWPKWALVAGDLGLLFTLAVGAGVWVRGWMGRHA